MEIILMALVVGFIITRNFIEKLKEHNAVVERAEEYVRDKTVFVTIEAVETNNYTTYLAYNYVTKDFIAQGTSEDHVKEEIVKRIPNRDIYKVKEVNGEISS